MDQNETHLHPLQRAVIGKLAFIPVARFNELLIDGLESEHVNYHIKRLVEIGMVLKTDQGYSLTDRGKDYVNSLDDTMVAVEKQAKISVRIWGVRENQSTGQVEHLLSRRLKQPYLGKVGRLGGKVQFGETVQEAAERELFEEAGLVAKSYVLERVYHKLRHRDDGEFVQDTLFFFFFVRDFSGTLMSKTENEENFWFPVSDYATANLDVFDDFEIDDRLEPLSPVRFEESVAVAKGY